MTFLRSQTLLLAGVALLTAASGGRAQVEDDAGLFDADTIARANRQIEDMQKQTGKGFIIATIKEAPAELLKKYNLLDAGQRRDFFDAVCAARLKGREFQGVYALISEDPKDIHVLVVPESNGKLFTPLNRGRLRDILIKRVQPDNPDQGVFQRMRNSMRSPRPNEGLVCALDAI